MYSDPVRVRFPGLVRAGMLVAFATLLTACPASGPEIRRDSNPSVNLATYKTFGYFSPLATDKAGYESVFTARLKESTRRVMETKGYAYTESNPDLLINFYANIEDRQEIRSTPTTSAGFYGYRAGYYGGYYGGAQDIQTVNYKAGTLSIDLVDAKQKVLAWQSTAEGRVSKEARQNPGPAIDAVVTEMMNPLPGPGGVPLPQ